MPLSFHPMQYSVVSGKRKLVSNNPFLRLTKDGQEIYIQGGQVYSPGTERLNTLPDWFEEEMKKQDKKALDEVGWEEHRKVGRPVSKEKLEEQLGKKDTTLHLKKETSKDA